MTEHARPQRSAGLAVSICVTVLLSASAAVMVGCGLFWALGREDTEPLESPLLLAVAHQLIRGPRELYGPFDGRSILVTIHPPLYYHVAALLGWPLVRAGLDPVAAALIGGRLLSFVGLLGTVVAAFRLARLDGMPRVAGWWAALLVAASLVVGAMPYTVRPDMLGIALQTTGVLLVLSTLSAEKPGPRTVVAAYAAFGLAVCIKQHFIVGPVLGTLMLLAASVRGRTSINIVSRGMLTGLAVILGVYGTEELVTEGRMSQAVFHAAAAATRFHSAGWIRGWIVFFGILGKSTGLIVVILAVNLAGTLARRGTGRRALLIVGIAVQGLIALWTVKYLFDMFGTDWDVALVFGTLAAAVFLVIPACFLMTLRDLTLKPTDKALCVYVAAELVLVLVLGSASTGSWINYGIQAVVFTSVLTARALSRALGNMKSPVASFLIIVAVVVLLLGVINDTTATTRSRRSERLAVADVFNHYHRPTNEFFFVDRPGLNRVHGWLSLVYDDWLYPVFESMHVAQPRSIWLRNGLVSDDIHFVVTKSAANNVDGVRESLSQLGYVPDIQIAEFFVWKRVVGGAASRR